MVSHKEIPNGITTKEPTDAHIRFLPLGLAMNTPVQNCFRALADPTRRDILVLLSQGDLSIAQVAEQFEMTRPAVKKHLTILHQGQLITVRRDGREAINSLAPDGLKSAADWMGYFDTFWDDRLSALKSAIESKDMTHD